MSSIRSKDTEPETLIRRGLYRKGFRYRLHVAGLPGKPDIVLTKHKAVIFVNGCFWHGHYCHLFKWPKTHEEFWKNKILGNCARDIQNRKKLSTLGWKCLTIWECSLKGKTRLPYDELLGEVEQWIINTADNGEIPNYLN